MVGGSFVKRPIIVVKNQMLALKANDIRDAFNVSIVFCDYERTRIEREHHARCINKTTLVIIRAGVLLCGNRQIRRVLALTVLHAIGAPNENCIVVESRPFAIAMSLGDGKEVRKSAINGIRRSARDIVRANTVTPRGVVVTTGKLSPVTSSARAIKPGFVEP